MDQGWFSQRTKSVDSVKFRGNFCFKFFDAKRKSLKEVQDYCGRYSSRLVTNDLFDSKDSTYASLYKELRYIMENKLEGGLKEKRFDEVFGINVNLAGLLLLTSN